MRVKAGSYLEVRNGVRIRSEMSSENGVWMLVGRRGDVWDSSAVFERGERMVWIVRQKELKSRLGFRPRDSTNRKTFRAKQRCHNSRSNASAQEGKERSLETQAKPKLRENIPFFLSIEMLLEPHAEK